MASHGEDGIRPYSANPAYWQYKGRPTLLLGGSVEDNLFQIPDLREHLDLLHSVGGNYVRCTMSSRDEDNVWPFEQDDATGLYDLERPGGEYWRRFERFLRLAAERDVIVQIELWDRFDYAREPWLSNPYNPKDNVNYTCEESHLAEAYDRHPAMRDNPFFRTLPSMDDNRPLLRFQHRQVDKLLDISLGYPNVLYCMNNETGEPHEWGQYWIRLIRQRAAERGATVFTTDMFDDGWKAQDSRAYPAVFRDGEHYTFIDISQVNSRNFHEVHWARLRWLVEQSQRHRRPVNHVKIYGSGHTFFGSGGPKDGVERFWRNLIGGSAAVRFHRPPSGNGLNERAQASIRAAREFESAAPPWRLEPMMELLMGRSCEVYLTGQAGKTYVAYFADGGSVGVDLGGAGGPFRLRWLSIAAGEWQQEAAVDAGSTVALNAPGGGDWLAVLSRRE
jgi:hypothetical protein